MLKTNVEIATTAEQHHQNRTTSTSTSTGNKPTDSTRDTDPNYILARFAVFYKALPNERVQQAMQEWMALGGKQDFASFLLAKHYLTPEVIDQLIKARDQYLAKQQARSPVAAVANGASAPAIDARTVTPLNGHAKPQAGGFKATTGFKTASTNQNSVRKTARPNTKEEAGEKTAPKILLNYQAGADLRDLLRQTSELGASDLHVHSGAHLRVRLNGKVRQANSTILSDKECESLIHAILNERQRKQLQENFQVDFSYEIPGVGRYRANAYKQRRGTDAVFRTIKPQPPTLAELGLPKELERYTEFHQGLVLFTGPAGCGKSSTMAAMVELANQSRPDHILTIEDPIEYVYESAACNVNQREAGYHTTSFSKALRAALREDPDIIVIGELRDFETISLALTAAETGHLVMGTLHTSGAIRTVNRLLGVFPPDQQAQLRVMLSESLKVVISQQLVQRADGKGRVPALEVLVNNKATGNLIRENRTFQIKSIMQTGGNEGQRLLDASLNKLLINRVITREEALKFADEPDNFN